MSFAVESMSHVITEFLSFRGRSIDLFNFKSCHSDPLSGDGDILVLSKVHMPRLIPEHLRVNMTIKRVQLLVDELPILILSNIPGNYTVLSWRLPYKNGDYVLRITSSNLSYECLYFVGRYVQLKFVKLNLFL